MISFHNDQKVKVAPQEVILKCIEENLIKVSKDGIVISSRWPKPLGATSCRGYRVCTLHYSGIRKQVKLHQIVWIAFNGPIPNGKIVDHINRDKADNRLINLRLLSNKENSQNRRTYKGSQNPSAKINKNIANKIKKEHEMGWSYTALANHFNVSKTLVAKIIRRELWV